MKRLLILIGLIALMASCRKEESSIYRVQMFVQPYTQYTMKFYNIGKDSIVYNDTTGKDNVTLENEIEVKKGDSLYLWLGKFGLNGLGGGLVVVDIYKNGEWWRTFRLVNDTIITVGWRE